MASSQPFRTGTLLGLAAGAAFGASAPLTQRFGSGLGPFTTGGCLYFGAALTSLVPFHGHEEAQVRRAHWPRLIVGALSGAFIAPACLAFGLQRASGTTASLMLNCEAMLTAILAALLLHEHVGKRVVVGTVSMFLGGAALVLGGHAAGRASWLGLVAILLATLGWAFDSVFSRPLAELDPTRIVGYKAAFGVVLSAGAAFAWGEPLPSRGAALGLVACGFGGYGLSLRLYLLAQRRIGAARTGAMFALAPFIGASFAWCLNQGTLGPATLLAAACFGLGAFLLATEQHAHAHTHEPLEHEHTHRHDDGHHDHVHEPPVRGEHSHPHRHEPLTHEHAHAPDVHHAHRHGTGDQFDRS